MLVIAGIGIGYVLTAPPPPHSQLRMGTTDSCETGMDPAYAYDYFGWEMVQALSSGLVEYRPGTTGGAISDIVPALATSWTTSADGLVWTFYLRPGVYYDSGREFTAYDVKYTFDRGMLGINAPDGAFVGIGFALIIGNVTVVDRYTVRFNLIQPYGAFLQLMTCPCTYMVDSDYAPYSHIINYTEGNARASYPGGLGPYTLQSWVRTAGKDVQIILAANPRYWNASGGYPKTKTMIITMYSDAAALVLALKSHDIDIAFRQFTVDQFRDLEAHQASYGVKTWYAPGPGIQYLVFQEKTAPWDNPQLRIAIASAINRTLITTTVFAGLAAPLYSMIPNGNPFHRDVFNVPGGANFNYTRTRAILNALGYSSTNKLVVNLYYETSGHYQMSSETALAVKTSIEAAGNITVNLTGLEWSAMGAARRAETMDVWIYGWYPDFIEADDYAMPFFYFGDYGNAWLHDHYSDPAMFQLVDWSRFNTSFTLRDLNYYKIQNLSVVDCPYVPMFQFGQFAATSPTIYGVYLDASTNWRNWLVYNGTA